MDSDLRTILYVEDDETIAEVVILTFESFGEFEVTHCKTGRGALDNFHKIKPQLVLMDVMMPEMDGIETMEHILRKFGRDCAQIIFLTAKAQTHEQVLYLEKGALGVILKPFDPMRLCQQIHEIWESRHAP